MLLFNRPAKVNKAFTLIELLVVIAIISLLAAILFPVFSRARERARRTSCLSNMKQIGIANHQYTQDFDERLPVSDELTSYVSDFMKPTAPANMLNSVQPYINNTQVYLCPSMKRDSTVTSTSVGETSYIPNLVVENQITSAITTAVTNTGRHIADLTRPAELVLVYEGAFRTNKLWAFPPYKNPGSLTVLGDEKFWSWYNANGDANTYAKIHDNGCNLLFVDGHAKWRDVRAMTNSDFGLTKPTCSVYSCDYDSYYQISLN